MKIKVFDIDYDIDDETMNEFIEEGVDAQLPNHFIFNDVDNVDELADRISNETGWCVNTFKYVELWNMKTFIVYYNGVEVGYIKATNHNQAEQKAYKRYKGDCRTVSVCYTELWVFDKSIVVWYNSF